MSDPRAYAVAAEHVFDGVDLRARAAVMIDRSNILRVVPQSELPGDMAVHALPETAWLAPGFIDLQGNGGADLLFNNSPTPATISAIAAAHRKFGTTGFLPTLISDSPAKMKAALDAVQASIDTQPSVLGIHLEGPFLSPRKAGIHDVRAIRAPTPADVEILALPRKGEMLMTLAPEEVPPAFVVRLARAGIRLSLGHSMATYPQTRQAMAEGMTGFTHLFNAMRPLESREPGPIAAAVPARGGEGMALVESFRGDVLAWVRLDDAGRIVRAHARDPSWFQWPLLEAAIEGNIVADFPLCNKSFNCSYSGHDL